MWLNSTPMAWFLFRRHTSPATRLAAAVNVN
jgi:hypothetical protein